MAISFSYPSPEIWVNYRFVDTETVEVVTEYGKVKKYGIWEFLYRTIQAIDISEGSITDIDVNLLLTYITTFAISAEDIYCLLNASANSFVGLLLLAGTLMSVGRLYDFKIKKNEKLSYIRKYKLIDIRYIKGREMQLETLYTILENEELSEKDRKDLSDTVNIIKEYLDITKKEKGK